MFGRLLLGIQGPHECLVGNIQTVIALAGSLLRNRRGVLALDDSLHGLIGSVHTHDRDLARLARRAKRLERAQRHLIVGRPHTGQVRMSNQQVLHDVQAFGAIPIGILLTNQLDARRLLHRLFQSGTALNAG